MNLHTIIKNVVNSKKVKQIRQAIRQEYPDWGWTHGGCFAFAEALTAALPKSELWAVGQFDQDANDWASQHAIVKYKEKFYDATGEVSEKFLLKTYRCKHLGEVKLGNVRLWTNEILEDYLWYPEQEFVENNEINLITKLLKSEIKLYDTKQNQTNQSKRKIKCTPSLKKNT